MADKWYKKSGTEGDVVISSRIRLARNLRDYPFPHLLNIQQKNEIANKIKDALENSNSYIAKSFNFINMARLSAVEASSLVERHLISPAFAKERAGKYLLITDDETISIMINEEDHLRIQVLSEGLSIKEAYQTADKIDTLLDNALGFAFHNKLGYLTQCPTNLGTGLRASVMLHLPALQASKVINRLEDNLSKIGLTLRGTFGEGSDAQIGLYQLSNQVTLGLSEETAIDNLQSVTIQIIGSERETRKESCKQLNTQDYIMRCLGTLKYARLVDNGECLSLLSSVRMGVSEKIIEGITLDGINALMTETQPATLTKNADKELTEQQRDKERASLLRNRLKNL
ncbi:MAG: protein arginine kinase [Acutalibacteraceae bacterium]|nr:protein arginine kinase [Acutalibacteraceae bacterium]